MDGLRTFGRFRQLDDVACRSMVEATMNEGLIRDVYRFELLKKGIRPEVLKALVHLAIKETELIFGRAKRKLETNCQISPKSTGCTIEGGTECGEHLAKLLSGLLIKQVGDEGFRVNRLTRDGK